MTKKPFLAFDSTPFQNKPKLPLKPIWVVYENALWAPSDDKDLPPRASRLSAAMDNVPEDVTHVILDIEQWPVYTSQRHRDQLLDVMSAYKQRNPAWKIGNYAIAPQRNHTASLLPPSDQAYIDWENNNKAVDAIAKASDVLCPSLYTMHPDASRWERYAVENLARTKALYWPQKPVIPFIWPQYHVNVPIIGGRYLDPDLWLVQLLTVWRMCEGFILWKISTVPQEQWPYNAPWVGVLRSFLANYT